MSVLKHLMSGSSLSAVAVFSAEAQGMNTNLTHVVSQDPQNVFNFICKTLEGIHKQTVSLVCGIAQLFIVRTFHGDDAQRWKAERTRDWLKAQLNERGLKQAMVYRYIATGQELARRIQKRYVWGGVMHEILAAESEQKGFNAVHRCVMEHGYLDATQKPALDWLLDGDKRPRFSLDVLRVNLGLDKLDETKQPGYVPPQKNDDKEPAAATIGAPATRSNPAAIAARVAADPDSLKGISEDAMAKAVQKVIGTEKMAERLISLCTLDECLKLQTVLNERVATLAAAPKVEKEEKEPKAEGKTTLPPNEMDTVSKGKRSERTRKGKKAA